MIKVGNMDEFSKGWFAGDFEPSLIKTPAIEIGIQTHDIDTKSDGHIHKIATEYNFILYGEVILDYNIRLSSDCYWITEPNQKIFVEFTRNTKLLVVKVPSVPGDKHYLKPEGERSEP